MAPTNELMLNNYHVQTICEGVLEDLLAKVIPEHEDGVSEAKVMEVSYSESKVKVSEPEPEPNAEYPVLDSESEVKVSEPEIKDSEMEIKVSEPEVEVSESELKTVPDPESEVKVSELEVEGSKPELKVSELETKSQLISKCPFGIIVWTKIPTKLFLDFCPEFFCSFLGVSWGLSM